MSHALCMLDTQGYTHILRIAKQVLEIFYLGVRRLYMKLANYLHVVPTFCW
jgi:hypothetical protein